MTFELLTRPTPHDGEAWFWVLRAKDGSVARSPGYFESEASARSHIARAKTAMKGARFAKVEVQ